MKGCVSHISSYLVAITITILSPHYHITCTGSVCVILTMFKIIMFSEVNVGNCSIDNMIKAQFLVLLVSYSVSKPSVNFYPLVLSTSLCTFLNNIMTGGQLTEW